MGHNSQTEVRARAVDGRMARQVAETMQALSAPARVTMLAHLRAGPTAVGKLAEVTGLEQSAVSHHLRVLRHLGLVVGERRGRRVFYSLHDSHVGALVDEAVYHVEHIRLAAGRTS
jgi:DNA-binding transcriptional ArsR family regulator